tara:strand:- start:1274 stop:1678 length:405 start_codon:yes stop_codon:yes gene_type:complete
MLRLEGDALRKAWPQLRYMIEQARNKSNCTDPFIVEDVYHQCMINDTYCYVVGEGTSIQGALFLRLVNNFGDMELHVWLACFRRPASLANHVDWLEELARTIKAVRITCHSPRAFGKYLEGTEVVSQRFVKELF